MNSDHSSLALPAAKRVKQPAVIATHSGTFHCDEALAVWMLRQLPMFASAALVRTRDPARLAAADIVVDVGGEYDPERLRFDHHQRGFEHTLTPSHATKLSSAGLVYKHFGRKVLTALYGEAAGQESVFYKLYRRFIESVDANDNGISQCDSPEKYQVNTALPARVGALNPDWFEDGVTDADRDQRFEEAVAVCGADFTREARYLVKSWLPGRSIVNEALAARSEVDPSGRIIVLPRFCPWKSHLFDLESELGLTKEQEILYCVHADSDGSWRVACASERDGGFRNRKSLPAAWCGLRDAALSAVAGVPDATFVHASGFIGGAKTFESALSMARQAVAS